MHQAQHMHGYAASSMVLFLRAIIGVVGNLLEGFARGRADAAIDSMHDDPRPRSLVHRSAVTLSWFTMRFVAMAAALRLASTLQDAHASMVREYADAETGLAGGKCSGAMTGEQRLLCREYTTVTSSTVATRFLRHVVAHTPTCGVANCSDVAAYASDTWLAWGLWLALLVVLVVWVVQIGGWIARHITGVVLHARLDAVDQSQDLLYRKRVNNPHLLRLLDEQPRLLNRHADDDDDTGTKVLYRRARTHSIST